MYEVMVKGYCIGHGYGAWDGISVRFDRKYKNKNGAIDAYDFQFRTYCKSHEGDLYYKDNNKFKIQKKRSSYIVIIEGEIREVDEKQEQMINLYKKNGEGFQELGTSEDTYE